MTFAAAIMPIYTFGYSGRDPQTLRDALEELDAVLVDIRYKPVSRQPGWSRHELVALLGNRYCYMSALGNKNYKGGDIVLSAPDIGITAIQTLAESNTVVLMCGCREYSKCHRATVSELLDYIDITTEELAWPEEPTGMPLEEAEAIARELVTAMSPRCHDIRVAGSIRRRKQFVKDIEIVCIPKWETINRADVLFDEDVSANRLYDWAIQPDCPVRWIKPGTKEVIDWHVKPEGRYWRGYIEKHDIKVDVFLVTPESWGIQFLIRTGSGDFSKAVVTHAANIGRPCADGQLHRSGIPIETPTEEDAFRVLGLKYIAPEHRTDGSKLKRVKTP